MKFDVRYEIAKRKEKMALWIAHRMPRWLVKWCAVRLGAHATCGKYGNTIVSELTFMDALKRWDEPNIK